MEKNITAYSGDGGYYLLANPTIETIDPDALGMTANDYDLYYFDQSQALEWRNYKQQPFNLENGTGYLYANSTDNMLAFNGELNPANTDITVDLVYDANAKFPGWNLVGNPFACNAYIDRSYYTMNDTGTEIVAVTGNSVEAREGIFVIAAEDGEAMTFTTEAPTNNGKGLALNLSKCGPSTGSGTASVIDRAIVRFGDGGMLPKFQMRNNSTKVYIPQDNRDYAVVSAENEGEMPVSFKAKENGTYTLTVNPEGVEMGYLHLIDNMTGDDVDLLSARDRGSSPAMRTEGMSYTFTAKTTDYASRFKLVFASSICEDANGDNETFAFISNGNIIVDGEGMLQVIDMMGRIVLSGDARPCVSTNGMTAGVYVLRLINGNDVKTQKMVVR